MRSLTGAAQVKLGKAQQGAQRLRNAADAVKERDAHIARLEARIQQMHGATARVPPSPQPRAQIAHRVERRLSNSELLRSYPYYSTGGTLGALLVQRVLQRANAHQSTIDALNKIAATLTNAIHSSSHAVSKPVVHRVGSTATGTAIEGHVDLDLMIATGYSQPDERRDLRRLQEVLSRFSQGWEVRGKTVPALVVRRRGRGCAHAAE